jgi:Saxitoxin biosynthesis operon protein SxtJ
MENQTDNKQLRSFGLLVGGIFAGIGVWPLVIHSAEPRWWSLIIAGALLLPAAIYPHSLVWPYKGWMALGHVMGWINTRIILGIVFYLVVTPIGIFRRWLGKDPMGQHLRPDLESYRVVRQPRQASHLTKQY